MKNPLARTLALVIILSSAHCILGCFTSIFNFGDSGSDTGNAVFVGLESGYPPACAFPPYGETYFNHPTGRCSDGRLMVDFIAHHFGLPLLPPYLRVKNKNNSQDLQKGVNFAFAGATALDASYLEERGIQNIDPNVSLGMEFDWFREFLPSLCDKSSSNCNQLFLRSLFIVGGGGNDYGYASATAKNMAEVRAFVPSVVQAIASTVAELIGLGAKHVVVSGRGPFGCSSSYLTKYMNSVQEEYNDIGCLKSFNELSEYHNEQLQAELNKLRELYPHTNIIYADLYEALTCLYRSPEEYGFAREALTACCGTGGPYNYNASLLCGYAPVKACDDPSLSISWDGIHLTEAAYRWIAKGFLEGPYTSPPLGTECVLVKQIAHSGATFSI